MKYVITCGDEGVQINEGVRLAVVGAGYELAGFSEVVAAYKKLFDAEIAIVASDENAWVKEKLELSTWEQTNASMQQHIAVLADKEGLQYAGSLPFADPQELEFEVKGHMVRPKGIHIGNTITFTLDGGEQKYNLGQYLISAEWITLLDESLAKSILDTQIAHYKTLGNSEDELRFNVQSGGALGEEFAANTKELLVKFGYISAE